MAYAVRTADGRLWRPGTHCTQPLAPSRRYTVRGGPFGHVVALRCDQTDHHAQKWTELYAVTVPRTVAASTPHSIIARRLADEARARFEHVGS
jgi:hypothetical protein